jgi:hypothetical protein
MSLFTLSRLPKAYPVASYISFDSFMKSKRKLPIPFRLFTSSMHNDRNKVGFILVDYLNKISPGSKML